MVLAGDMGRGGKLVFFSFLPLFTSISPATDCRVEGSPGLGVECDWRDKLGLHGQAGGFLVPAEVT